MKNKQKIIIEFDNDKAAKHFASWLCDQGEQDYWLYMECREQEEEGNITATKFNYHGESGEESFMEDNIIRTSVGRLDEK
jgi:hypothetical protein